MLNNSIISIFVCFPFSLICNTNENDEKFIRSSINKNTTATLFQGLYLVRGDGNTLFVENHRHRALHHH